MASNAAQISVGIDTNSIPAQFQAAMQRVQNSVKPIDIKINAFALGQISGNIKDLNSSLSAASARVTAFAATTSVLYGLVRAFKELGETTVNTQKKIIELQSILGNASFDKLSAGLFSAARQTATSFDEAAEAAKELAKQGLTVNEILSRTTIALNLARISGLSAADSVKALASATSAYNNEALTFQSVTNKITAVSNQFSVSQKDLANGIERSGESAAAARVSFDQFLGAIAAIKQSTQKDGATIANTLNTIFTKLTKDSTKEELKDLGVAFTDTAGNALGSIQILTNLAGVYKNLSQQQRDNISEQLAGIRQGNSFKALLSDLARGNSILANAQKASANATNDAARQQDKLNQSLSSQASILGNNVKEVFSKIGQSTFVGPTTGLLKDLNNFFEKGDSKNSETAGSKAAEGFLKGIGSIISGPGLVLISKVIFGLFARVGGYAVDAVKELSGLNSESGKQAETQAAISRLLQQGNAFYLERLSRARTVGEQEAIILELMRAQNLEIQKSSSRFASVANNFGSSGGLVTRAAGGLLPALNAEQNSITNGIGGVSTGSRPTVIPNFNFGGKQGPVVANTGEYIVKNFAGGYGSAIFNPNMVNSVGGLGNLSSFGNVSKVAANGLVPNFAFSDLFKRNRLSKDEQKYEGLLLDHKLKYIYDDNNSISIDRRLEARQRGYELIGPQDAQYVQENPELLKGFKLKVFDPTSLFRDIVGNTSSFSVASAVPFKGDKLREAQLSKALPKSQLLSSFLNTHRLGADNISGFLNKASKSFGSNFFVKGRAGAQGDSVYGRDVIQEALTELPNPESHFIQAGIPNISGREFRVTLGQGNKVNLLGAAALRAEHGQLNHEFFEGGRKKEKLFSKAGFGDFLSRKIAEIQAKKAFSSIPEKYRAGGIAGLDVLETGNTGLRKLGQLFTESLGINTLKGGGAVEFNFSQNYDSHEKYGVQHGYSGSLDRIDVLTNAAKSLEQYYSGVNFAGGHIPNFSPLNRALNTERNLTGENPRVGFDSRVGVGVYSPSQGSLSNAINYHLSNEPGRNLNNLKNTGLANQYKFPNFAPIPAPASLGAALSGAGSNFSASQLNATLTALQNAINRNTAAAQEEADQRRESLLVAKSQVGERYDTGEINFLESRARQRELRGVGLTETSAQDLLQKGGPRAANLINPLLNKAVSDTQNLRRVAVSNSIQKRIADFFEKESNLGGIKGLTTAGVQGRFGKLGIGQLNNDQQSLFNESLNKLGGQRNQNRRQALFGASFALPIFTQEALAFRQDPNSQSSRRIGGVAEAVSSGVSIASLVPGAPGVAIGAGLAAIQSIRAITGNVGKSLEDFQKDLEKSTALLADQNNAIGTTVRAYSNLQSVIEENGSKTAVGRASRELTTSLSQVTGSNRVDLLEALRTGNSDKIGDVQSRIQQDSALKQRSNDLFGRIGELTEYGQSKAGPAGFFADHLLGSRRNQLNAVRSGDASLTGGIFDLFHGGLHTSDFTPAGIPIRAFHGISNLITGNRDQDNFTEENVRKSFKDLPKEKLKSIDDYLASTPIDFSKVGLTKIQNRTKQGGNTLDGLKDILSQGGVKDKDLLSGLDTLSARDINKLYKNEINRAKDAGKSAEVAKDAAEAGQSINKFVQLSQDILQNVAFVFNSRNLAVAGQRERIQDLSQGFVDIKGAAISPEGRNSISLAQSQARTTGNTSEEINKLITGSLANLRLPQGVIGQKGISDQIAQSVSNIVKNPANVGNELRNIGKSLNRSGEVDASIVESFKKGGDNLSEQIFLALQKGGQEAAKNLLQSQIEGAKITRERQSGFFGGNFKELLNPNFATLTNSFAGFRNNNLLSRRSGDLVLDQRRNSQILTDQASGILELERLKFLPTEGPQRDKFRGVIQGAIQSNYNGGLNQLIRTAPNNEIKTLLQGLRPNIEGAARVQAENLLPGQNGVKDVVSSLNAQQKSDQAGNEQINQQIAATIANKTSLDKVDEQLANLIKSNAGVIGSQEKLQQAIDNALGKTGSGPNVPTTSSARGYVPNFSAYSNEINAIKQGVGGALSGDRPTFANINGLGGTVVNTGEKIIRNFLGSNKDAVFNREMSREYGLPLSTLGNVGAARGYVPNFADDPEAIYHKVIDRFTNKHSHQGLIDSIANGSYVASPHVDSINKIISNSSNSLLTEPTKYAANILGDLQLYFKNGGTDKNLYNSIATRVNGLRSRLGQDTSKSNPAIVNFYKNFLKGYETDARQIYKVSGLNLAADPAARRAGFRNEQQRQEFITGGNLISNNSHPQIGVGLGGTTINDDGAASGYIPNFADFTHGDLFQTLGSQFAQIQASIPKLLGPRRHKQRRYVGPLTRVKNLIDGGNLQEARYLIETGGLPEAFLQRGLDSHNLEGVSLAIQREQQALAGRGIPTNLAAGLIYTGYDSQIGGIGVANAIDEPRGLYDRNAGIRQGIERVKNQGGNPRAAGTPNFAVKDTEKDDLIKSIKDLVDKLNKQDNKTSSDKNNTTGDSVKVDHSIAISASINGNVQTNSDQISAIIQKGLDDMKARISALEKSQKNNPDYQAKPPIAAGIGSTSV